MPQFLVIAYDATDGEAEKRRAAVRPAHLVAIDPLIADGRVFCAATLLDDDGRVIGSTLIVDMSDRAAVDAWLDQEPFRQRGVWQRVEVRPIRVVVRDGKRLTP